MYIMVPEPISTAHFINPSHQSVCLHAYPSYRCKATKLKLNSVALVRKRYIPTERPPLSAKYCRLLRVEGVTCSAQRIPTAVNLGFLERRRYLRQRLAETFPREGI
jgi:hypothetical protein